MFFDISQNTIDKIKQTVISAQSIAIIGHTAPDADAVSSVLGLYSFFTKLYDSKNIIPVLPDELPTNILWFNDLGKIKIGQEAQPYIMQADVIFCVDLNETKRVGILEDALKQSEAFKIIIDHHPEPENFADITLSFPEAGSTTEIIYDFLKNYEPQILDKVIATYLFTGLLTDTGCFCHDSADVTSFAIASELLKFGINKSEIIQNVFNNYSYDRMRLMGYVLLNKLKILPEYGFGYISLSQEEMRKFNYKYGDHENFVNLPLSIKGIHTSVMFMEMPDKVRVSLRSVGVIDVSKIARKYLGGGGHKNAAGGNMPLPLEKAEKEFLTNILPKFFEDER